MKTELTTNANELNKRVELKLSTLFSEKCTLFFSVFPSLGTNHFSIQYVKEEQPFLIVRQWKWNQKTAFPLGIHIYDLSNINIKEQKIPLSTGDYSFISDIQEMEIIIEELDGVMLDGDYFKLVISQQEYHWRMMHQVSKELQELLDKLVRLAGVIY